MSIGHYGLTYDPRAAAGPNDTEFRACSTYARTEAGSARSSPGKNSYPREQQTSNEVGIRTDYLTGEDLFVITDQINSNGTDRVQGPGQAARQPDLARRPRVRDRLARRAVAERGRAAAARGPVPGAAGVRPGMTAAALAIGAVLACACVLFVALPFLREPDPSRTGWTSRGRSRSARSSSPEEKDRALAALKELEFDHRTGKISDEDYRELIGPLRARVAEALRALEPHAESTEERVHAAG
jgi:hypothetical protein